MLLLAVITDTAIHELETLVLLLLAFVIIFALVARKLDTPYPIVLVVAGLLVGFLPGFPQFKLDPDLVFLLLLPPLLFSAAWNTSWRSFRFNLLSIASLAFGLVGFTALAVALMAPLVFAGFDWRLGFVLGAIVSTTDAVAAVSIAKRIGLPSRIIDLLEGESLLNDASGLLVLEFAISLVVSGQFPSFTAGLGRLLWLTAGGLAVGLAIAFVIDRIERLVDYGSVEIMLSLLIPFGAYLTAEAIHSSGILAVVACGLYLGNRSAELFSPSVRLKISAVWEALSFGLNGLTFILIGLQLPAIWASVSSAGWRQPVVDGLDCCVLLVLIRMLWVYPGAYLGTFLRRRLLKQEVEFPSGREVFLVGWTGMRGVIALAAALSLPAFLDNGERFPQRGLLIFLSFSVILFSLVLQGLTLPKLIHFLGLEGADNSAQKERQAQRLVLGEVLSYIDRRRQADAPELSHIYDHLASHYRARLDDLLDADDTERHFPAEQTVRYRAISRELIGVERQTALALRSQGKIDDESWRTLEREIDLADLRAAQSG